MSFLHNLGGAAGGNAAASGLGNLIDVAPSRVSMIADRIGTGMNSIAQAGGAAPGYAAQAAPQQAAAPDNHLQLLDPNILKTLVAKFGGRGYAQ